MIGKISGLIRLVPGIVLSAIIAFGAAKTAPYIGETLMGFDRSPVSPVMVAMLGGMILANTVTVPRIFDEGINWASKNLLKCGIVLMGMRLSIVDVFGLGSMAIPLVILCVVIALLAVRLIGRLLGTGPALSTLIAVGTSICGVSAILATGPAIEAREEEIGYAVSTITVFGLLGLLVYPFLAHFLFNGEGRSIGFFFGTAIHDTSQVTGAALLYTHVFGGAEVLDTAIVTKLVRNLTMAFVIPYLALRHALNETGTAAAPGRRRSITQVVPLFIMGFVLMSLIRTIGDAVMYRSGHDVALNLQTQWRGIVTVLSDISPVFLLIALAGIGLNTRLARFVHLGIRPFVVGFSAALVVGIVSFASIRLGFLVLGL